MLCMLCCRLGDSGCTTVGHGMLVQQLCLWFLLCWLDVASFRGLLLALAYAGLRTRRVVGIAW
jgi:hypothetical protein